MENDKLAASRQNRIASAFEWVGVLIASLLVMVVLFTFFFRIVRVEGNSMSSTLSENDQLLIMTGVTEFVHGDIVVVDRYTVDPLVKRVIAVAGDTLRITNDGKVYLNGDVLGEPYVTGLTFPKDCTDTVIVPEGYVFVMGDNRAASLDSRSNEIGLVLIKDIVGKALFRVFPLSSFGGIYDNMEYERLT